MAEASIPTKQRALIFQGGGSLGAYEAGVFRALYEKITKVDDSIEKGGVPLFDIVAGTSIGAINASILVSHFVKNKSWKGSAEKLYQFWDYLSTESSSDSTPGFGCWWNFWHSIENGVAPGEAARRYYSAKEFQVYGASKVFLPLPPQVDN